jgi:hypothetical protein
MSRTLRFIPKEGTLVEVTCRTVQSRLLLTPRPDVCEVITGVLGRAQKRFEMKVCAAVFLSNHFHMLLVVDDARQLDRFMEYVDSNIAREVGRLVEWRDKFWSSRYRAIVVSEEEVAQIDRLRYVLSQGVKEGLVEKVQDWPGVHSGRAYLDGEGLKGYWFDRTKEGAARRRGETPDRLAYATEEDVVLSPLPCWKDRSDDWVRERVHELVEEIEREAAVERERKRCPPLGVRAILAQHPHSQPKKTKRSAAPRFHAATKAVRDGLREAYSLFVLAFREAAEKLSRGDRSARFPAGSFPPALPFVMPWI